jgi:LssY C-terminus
MQLLFTRLGTLPINAVVASLENSRESVDEAGKIIGIDASTTYGGLLDKGVSKLQTSDRFAGLAGLIQGAKQALKIQDVNPNIDYEPGVEMTLRLTRAVEWQSATTGPESKPQPFRDESALPDLVNRQPFRTVARSAERASDLTNLMFIGTAEEVTAAFAEAGWSQASSLSGVSRLETARALIEDRGYKEGPMSVLLLDAEPPDFAYQKGNNTFSQRHHLRIFRHPGAFEGRPIWVCSATHDIDLRYSDRDYTFIHVIDPDIDKERSKVVNDLIFTGMVRSLALVDRYDIPQNATNATGDPLHTDGRMAVLLLQ